MKKSVPAERVCVEEGWFCGAEEASGHRKDHSKDEVGRDHCGPPTFPGQVQTSMLCFTLSASRMPGVACIIIVHLFQVLLLCCLLRQALSLWAGCSRPVPDVSLFLIPSVTVLKGKIFRK